MQSQPTWTAGDQGAQRAAGGLHVWIVLLMYDSDNATPFENTTGKPMHEWDRELSDPRPDPTADATTSAR